MPTEDFKETVKQQADIVRLVGDGRAFDMPAGFSDRLKSILAPKLGS